MWQMKQSPQCRVGYAAFQGSVLSKDSPISSCHLLSAVIASTVCARCVVYPQHCSCQLSLLLLESSGSEEKPKNEMKPGQFIQAYRYRSTVATFNNELAFQIHTICFS